MPETIRAARTITRCAPHDIDVADADARDLLIVSRKMDANEVVTLLGLEAHPEGGFFKEVFRDPTLVAHPVHGKPRAAVTMIDFLLPAGTFSALHRVAQTEIWVHLAGDPVDLHVIEDGAHRVIALGDGLATKQWAVPAHAWQAAVPRGRSWSLCGCTVAPGFDFEDFEMPSRADLLQLLSGHRELVLRLTR